MNVYQKLNAAREEFHTLKLTKTGNNKFAGYKYFELGDFLIPAMGVFAKHGLCAIVSFDSEQARMEIIDTEKPESIIAITSPMGSAALKGCHEVQNIGAVETYQRRYLWVTALEIVEHDALDATTGDSKLFTAIQQGMPEKGTADHPDWPSGPHKGISSMKTYARQLWRDITAASDVDSLDIVLDDARETFAAMREDTP